MTRYLRRLGMIVLLASIAPGIGRADCYDSASQNDLNACAGAAYKKADAELNASYATVHQRLSSDGQIRLRNAQRAWISYRDAECAFQSSGDDGGSAAVMIDLQCLALLTSQRAKELDGMRSCAEGDISCPQ